MSVEATWMNLTLAQSSPPPPPPPSTNEAAKPATTAPAGPQTQTVQPAPGTHSTTPTPAAPETASPWGGVWIPLLLLVVVFYLLVLMPQRRERKQRDQMLSAVKKGDRVQTIGGILGTVVDIRESEIILKVDEANNTRLHFSKAAVQAVLPDGKPQA